MSIANPLRICVECGAEFEAHHGQQRFCMPEHKRAFHRLMAKRGQTMFAFVQTWRMGKRGKTADSTYAMVQLAAFADLCNAQDRREGRNAALIVGEKREARWSVCDLEI